MTRPLLDRCAIAFLGVLSNWAETDEPGSVQKTPEEAFDEAPPEEKKSFLAALQAVLDEAAKPTQTEGA